MKPPKPIDLFDTEAVEIVIERIRQLTPETRPEWGTMNAAQMLAHCHVPYGYVFDPDSSRRPSLPLRLMMKLFVKPMVVGAKPYGRNLRTAPEFLIANDRDFEVERDRLIGDLERACKLGRDHFEGRENPNFGRLSANEWNTLFAKHLDHHLVQFGV